jgi:thiamine-monophosphate kinase
VESFVQAAESAGVALTAIGQVVAGTGAPRFLDADGAEIALKRLSYSHF